MLKTSGVEVRDAVRWRSCVYNGRKKEWNCGSGRAVYCVGY